MLELCVSLLLVTGILGAPGQTLLKEIQLHSCVFPVNLKFLPKCSAFTLSSNISDLHKQENVEFYLCIALLDSTTRLCPLVTKNKDFGIRVKKALNESMPTIMSSDDRFCNEMTLDPNTTLDQAKFIYNKLRPPHCLSICIGLDDNDAALRVPVCKSIQFAHQQIKVARDLQQQLNKQDSKPEMDKSEINPKANPEKDLINNSNLPREDQPPPHILSTQNSNLQESHSSQNRATAPKPEGSIISGDHSQANDHSIVETQEGQERSKMGTAPVGAGDVNLEKGSEKTAEDDRKAKQVPAPLAGADAAEAVAKVVANKPAGASDVEPLTDDEPPLDQQEQLDDTKEEITAGKDEPVENVGNGDDDGDDTIVNQHRGQQMEDEEVDNKYLESQKDAAKDGGSPNVMEKPSNSDAPHSYSKPRTVIVTPFVEAEDSHFFTYFLSSSAFFILGYLVYHNKRKIIAMAVEGKKGRNTGRRRPNSASYHKLDSNLEEAMSSNLSSTNSYVIY